MELPDTIFVRAKDICRCLGITKDDLRKVARAGLIHRIKFARRRRGKYLRKEIIRVFLKGVSL